MWSTHCQFPLLSVSDCTYMKMFFEYMLNKHAYIHSSCLQSPPMLCILNMRDWVSRPQIFAQQILSPCNSPHIIICTLCQSPLHLSLIISLHYHKKNKFSSQSLLSEVLVKVPIAPSFYWLTKLWICTTYLIAPSVTACKGYKCVQKHM